MAQRTEPPTSSPRGPMIVMVTGGLLVAGLVAWALTRTVEPAPVQTATYPNAETGPSAVTGTMPLSTATPSPSTTAPTSTLTPGSFSISEHGQEPEKATVARISAEDLKVKFDSGNVTIIDVRNADSYASGHIPGSLNIPMTSIQSQLASIPKDKPIVAYCT